MEILRIEKHMKINGNKKSVLNELLNERGKYQKHKREFVETDRYIIRTIDTWIDGTRWRIRPDDQENEEMEAWVNTEDQEIVYNIAHPMFKAAEISDKTIGKSTESGSGIAVQIHIHKSIAVAWGIFHDSTEKGTFFERYNEYIQLAAKRIREDRSKFINDIPDEKLEELLVSN